jgi:hypothetical protein
LAEEDLEEFVVDMQLAKQKATTKTETIFSPYSYPEGNMNLLTDITFWMARIKPQDERSSP